MNTSIRMAHFGTEDETRLTPIERDRDTEICQNLNQPEAIEHTSEMRIAT